MANKRVQIWQFNNGCKGKKRYICSRSMAVVDMMLPTVLEWECCRIDYMLAPCVKFLEHWWAVDTADSHGKDEKLGTWLLQLPGDITLERLIPTHTLEWWNGELINIAARKRRAEKRAAAKKPKTKSAKKRKPKKHVATVADLRRRYGACE